MTRPDLKTAALEFTRKNSCPPACVIEKAMEVGAALMAESVLTDQRAMRKEMNENRKDIERGTPHGHCNGGLQI